MIIKTIRIREKDREMLNRANVILKETNNNIKIKQINDFNTRKEFNDYLRRIQNVR